jgi:hypothetical protein
MKAKDFLKKVNDQGKINNEDFNKALETFPDQELPDVWVNLFNEGFLTRERAVADPDITKKIKAETLNAVDANMKKILPLLDARDREEIEKEASSYKKIEMLEKAIPNLLSKVKGENPSTDEKVKQLEKNVQEFADKVTTVTREKDEYIKTIQAQHEQEKSNLKLDWTMDKKLGDYTFADEFIPIKQAIIKNIVDTVKGSNTLQLDEKGQIVVVDIDPSTKVAKPKFNGNDPVTIDSLLSEPLKNFLKKNNSQDDKKKPEPGRRRETPEDVDPSKMTLQERRKAAFVPQG